MTILREKHEKAHKVQTYTDRPHTKQKENLTCTILSQLQVKQELTGGLN